MNQYPSSARDVVARLIPLALLALMTLSLGACVSDPAPRISRQGDVHASQMSDRQDSQTAKTAQVVIDGQVQTMAVADPDATVESDQVQPRIHRGTGQMIDRAVAASPRPNLSGTTGDARFNFEGESLHAVVQAILGDMLGQNYVIAPGVKGNVTLATPKPVSPAGALSLLEMVLGWNGARMIYSDGRYNIVPADQPLAGSVAPEVGPATNVRGFEVRTVPLQYISASEMKKILEPYARSTAIVGTNAARNTISIAGSQVELQNYLRTIEIFDVDWLAGMSVGVFPLQSGNAVGVVESLEQVFGTDSDSPVAGMFRFMPLEAANAVMVITPQAGYLDDIGQWLERIDNAGGMSLYTYRLKYIQASDLALRLSEVFGGSSSGGGRGKTSALMPGLSPVQLGGDGGGTGAADGKGAVSGGQSGTLSLNPEQGGNASVNLEVEGIEVGVSAVEETNSLLVRASPQAWRSIKNVIEQLDVMPMQVHIEAQVVTVQLSGELSYGVNWYFENAVTDVGLPSADGRNIWGDLAGSVAGAGANPAGVAWTFLGRNAAAVISALDQVTDVKLLQSPSVLVRNNSTATFQVGSRIPISSVRINPIIGGGDSTISQVQYIDTGIILNVRPRVSRDGVVFLDIVQEISSPVGQADEFGNVRIDTRKLKTEAMIQSGDTVMLAGLISDGSSRGSSGFPGLSRIPIIGGLFGTQTTKSKREETIILLTPRIVRNPLQARQLTDEYGARFRALEPLQPAKID